MTFTTFQLFCIALEKWHSAHPYWVLKVRHSIHGERFVLFFFLNSDEYCLISVICYCLLYWFLQFFWLTLRSLRQILSCSSQFEISAMVNLHPPDDEDRCTDFFCLLFWSYSALAVLEQPFYTLIFSWPCRICQILLMIENMHYILSRSCSFPKSGVSPHCPKISQLNTARRLCGRHQRAGSEDLGVRGCSGTVLRIELAKTTGTTSTINDFALLSPSVAQCQRSIPCLSRNFLRV